MRLGIIGCGNLGSSILEGIIKEGIVSPKNIIASDLDENRLREVKKLGVRTTIDNNIVSNESDIIFLAVEPNSIRKVLEGLDLGEGTLLVSLAAGISIDYIKKFTNARVIRVMPNICASVGKMASAFSLGEDTLKKDEESVKNLLEKLGYTIKIEEKFMNAVTGLSGSGPAFVFSFIRAFKNAGIELGLEENKALKLGIFTLIGSSELVMNSEKNINELIDMVSSPKGTTIEGLKVLEKKDFEKIVKEAILAAEERSRELSK